MPRLQHNIGLITGAARVLYRAAGFKGHLVALEKGLDDSSDFTTV